MNPRDVVILAAKRTPIGSFQGALKSVPAPQLGAVAAKAALAEAGVKPEQVEEVYVGCVLPANVGQAPARQVALAAGLPNSVPCTTINKVCGSGLKAVMLAAQGIKAGDCDVAVAGGMESMSNVPYYLTQARTGYRMGDGKVVDGIIYDGLWDPYGDFHMGIAGETCSTEYKLTREAQDEFARESYRRALAATKEGLFKNEIVNVEVPQRKGDPIVVSEDEEPSRGDPSKFDKLRPAFKKDGTITAANASSINDGASALVLATEKAVKEQNLTPLARIVGYGGAAQAPEWFTTAPSKAIDVTLNKLNLKKDAIDLWEINEAFSCVTMACSQISGLDPAKVNVRGGAVAMGHPIGASGARILTTLLFAMKDHKAKQGLATLCIGGGEAVAVVIENM